MEKLYDPKEKLTREPDEIAEKPEPGAGDLELIHKLTDTIRNIEKIYALEELRGYSEAGDYEGSSCGMENMLKEQVNQGNRLETLESRDGGMWRKVVGYAVTAVVGIAVGYLFKQAGM